VKYLRISYLVNRVIARTIWIRKKKMSRSTQIDWPALDFIPNAKTYPTMIRKKSIKLFKSIKIDHNIQHIIISLNVLIYIPSLFKYNSNLNKRIPNTPTFFPYSNILHQCSKCSIFLRLPSISSTSIQPPINHSYSPQLFLLL